MTYQDLDEVIRKRVLQRKTESSTPFGEEETLRLLKVLKEAGKPLSFEKLALLCEIPSWRYNQILIALKTHDEVKLHYHKGEWFAEV